MARTTRKKTYQSREDRLAAADNATTGRAGKKQKKSGFPKILILFPVIAGVLIVLAGGIYVAVIKAQRAAVPQPISVRQLNFQTSNNADGDLALATSEFEIVFQGQEHDGRPFRINPPVDGFSLETPVELEARQQADGTRYAYDQENRELTIERGDYRFILNYPERTISSQGKTWKINSHADRDEPLKLVVNLAGIVAEYVPPVVVRHPTLPDLWLGDEETSLLTPDERAALIHEHLLKYPININLAGNNYLERLPGIGPVKSDAIYLYRDTNGPFESIDDLQKVEGIGKGLLNRIRPYIILDESERPIIEE